MERRRQRWVLAAGLCLLMQGVVAAEETARPQTAAPRRYSSRVQMHEVPLGVELPEEKTERSTPLPATLGLDRESPAQAIPLLPLLENVPYVPARIPARPARTRNWLHLPLWGEKETSELKADKKKELATPSGWGWLADDVRARTDRRKADEEETAEHEQQATEQPPLSRDDQKGVDRAREAPVTAPADQSPLSSAVLREVSERDVRETVANHLSAGPGRTPGAEPPRTPSLPTPVSALEPNQQTLELSSPWDRERPWGWNERRRDEGVPSLLPRTQALLSRAPVGKPVGVAGDQELAPPRSIPSAPELPVQSTDQDVNPRPSTGGAPTFRPSFSTPFAFPTLQGAPTFGPWKSPAGHALAEPTTPRVSTPTPSRGLEPTRLPGPTVGWGAGTATPQPLPWSQPLAPAP